MNPQRYVSIIAEIIATWFYVGKSPFAPGTWGSLAALPLVILPLWIEGRWKVSVMMGFYGERAILVLPILLLIISLIVFFIGWWASARYVKDKGAEDPGEVVIDEVAGMLLTLAITILPHTFLIMRFTDNMIIISPFYFWLLFFASLSFEFVFFRIFDIVKPWPIGCIDKKVKGGFGIMADDMVAGIFAGVLATIILLWI